MDNFSRGRGKSLMKRNEILERVTGQQKMKCNPYGYNRKMAATYSSGVFNSQVHRGMACTQSSGQVTKYGYFKKMFKIMIPYGVKYNKCWLLQNIQETCGLMFKAVQFHYVNGMAVFFVDNVVTARSLEQASGKIQGEENYKILINVRPPTSPDFRSWTLSAFEINWLKLCLQRRYNSNEQALDLSNLWNDPDLRSVNILLPFNKKCCMEMVFKMVEEYCAELLALNLSSNCLYRLHGLSSLFYMTPKLKSLNLSENKLAVEQDLDIIQNIQLTELWLEGNPLCTSLKNLSSYYSTVKRLFPKVNKLDGYNVQETAFFEADIPTGLPQLKGSFFANQEIEVFLTMFLQNFQWVKKYLLESRNLLRIKRTASKHLLMKHNNMEVVGFLCNLPKTQHELSSFTVDVSLQTETMLCFTVGGIFKEVYGRWKDMFRYFCRVFVLVPAAEGCAQIMNDQLMIMNTPCKDFQKISLQPTQPLPSIQNPISTLNPQTADIVAAFSKHTGMNPVWAQKCLDENNWNIAQAAEVFAAFKEQGIIPEEAFKILTE
ncbi:nuclear RNA export factor 1-like isoform X2 [Rhinatrema bivittatum]|uniref:nuclear RNA export factor 1-like isoform X2 n=1 Tax=Rhinatrema bivittatum TaxID=194408 RepID=UPI001128CA40|nr:nuclear RNA export factor 1-like isoform X2 [Rhinatrema bivittatum]